MNTFQELLLTYKNLPPEGVFITPYYQEHLVYWLLLKMSQLGRPELLSVVALQLGVQEMALRMAIETIHVSNPLFPLSIGKHLKTRHDTVHIDQDAVGRLRQAAIEVSPEHMPDQLFKEQRDGKIVDIGAEYFFHVFSQPPSPEHPKYPVHDVLRIFEATEGIDDAQIVKREQREKLIEILTPNVQIIVMPVCGPSETGFYADRLDVLDLRDESQQCSTAAYPPEKTLPLIISLGFTQSARLACLSSPKVLLIELWAFLRIIGSVQKIKHRNAGQQAFSHIKHLLNEPSSSTGRFYPDGFVNPTVTFLTQKYQSN
jgi:hypothetical protein